MSDHSAEEKIKDAARKVFTCKGYAGARTRDIAQEAGVNIALLNYYFHGKKNLFEMVMLEQMVAFKQGMVGVFTDESTSLDRKIELLAGNYIDLFTRQPDLPLFFLTELRLSEEEFLAKMSPTETLVGSIFFKQITAALTKRGNEHLSPFHIMMNIGGMAMFPFLISPLIRRRLDQQQFDAMMTERKRLIPIWIKAILEADYTTISKTITHV